MTRFLTGAALSIALALPAAAQEGVDAGTVLARVGDTEITLGHVVSMLRVLPPEYQG